MKFVYYTDCDQLPDTAIALFEKAEKDSIFFSRPWFENLVAAAKEDGQSTVLACVMAERKVMAILPLIQHPGNHWNSLKHRYTTHFSLLLEDDDRPQVLACLVQGLKKLSLHALLLEPVADDDSRVNSLQQALEADGFRCESMFRFYNWTYRVQGQTFDDYMAARPAILRNTISRKQRKLDREHGYAIRLYSGDEAPSAMPDYHAVYRASWKANEQYTCFLNGIVAGFSRQGWTRLAVLYVKNQPIAAQLWFVAHGRANIFRLAYDEKWRAYSPGSILTSYLMAYVIDTDKVDEIDFLTGNDAYKQDWMSDRRERTALSCLKTVKPTNTYGKLAEYLKRILQTG